MRRTSCRNWYFIKDVFVKLLKYRIIPRYYMHLIYQDKRQKEREIKGETTAVRIDKVYLRDM